MRNYDNFDKYTDECYASICIGKFDAIHLGHQKLIHKVVENTNSDTKSIIISLNDGAKTLFSEKEKISILEKFKVDYYINININEIKNMTATKFLNEIIINKINAKYICCGNDFKFGRNREGDVNLLKDFCIKNAIKLEVIDKINIDENEISSSIVRDYLLSGNIRQVNKLLGFNYFIFGEVVKGNQIGRKIGVPTANIKWPNKKILPPKGVYVSKVYYNAKEYYGIANIGNKPTIGDKISPLLEVNIFDLNEDLYHKKIKVELLEFIRKEEKFSTIEMLKKVLYNDIKMTKKYLKDIGEL